MGVDFTADGQGIEFGAQATGLTTYSVISRYWADGNGYVAQGGCIFNIGQSTPTVPAHLFGVMNLGLTDATIPAANNDLLMIVSFSGTAGQWYTNVAPSFAAWHTAGITYDNTNVANDPIFYLDGSPVAITEDLTPVGNAVITSDLIGIGLVADQNSYTHEGQIASLLLYNVILTAQEMSIIHTSRMTNIIRRGLIFAPNLDGAAGLSIFDNTVLGAANAFVDPISGGYGTVVGAPRGKGNRVTNVGIGVQ